MSENRDPEAEKGERADPENARLADSERTERNLSSRLVKVVDAVLIATVVSLVLGFFTLLWRTSTDIQHQLTELNDKAESAKRQYKAAQNVVSESWAELRVELRDVTAGFAELEEVVEWQMTQIKSLNSRLPEPESQDAEPQEPPDPPRRDSGFAIEQRTQDLHQLRGEMLQRFEDSPMLR